MEKGAASPGRWHSWQWRWMMGAMSFVQVTGAGLAAGGVAESEKAAAKKANALSGRGMGMPNRIAVGSERRNRRGLKIVSYSARTRVRLTADFHGLSENLGVCQRILCKRRLV